MKRPRNRGIFPPNLPPAVLELAKERANQKLARDLIDVHNKFVDKLEEVNETIYQRVGPKGERGAPGKTPEKGVDYFTDDELRTIVNYLASTVKVPNDGRDGKDGRDGRDGIDGKNGKDAVVDVDAVVERVRKLIKAPKDGKDATISIDDIVSKILTLPGEKFKLNTKQIDGLDQTIRAMQSQIGERGYLHGGGDTVQAGTNITLTRLANGKTLISSTGGGTPGGPVNSIQYNNPLGTFAGDAGFIRDITNATTRYGVYSGPIASGAQSNYGGFFDNQIGGVNNWNLWSGPSLVMFTDPYDGQHATNVFNGNDVSLQSVIGDGEGAVFTVISNVSSANPNGIATGIHGIATSTGNQPIVALAGSSNESFHQSSGLLTSQSAVVTYIENTGPVTNTILFDGGQPVITSSTITNLYGLFIGDIIAGSAINQAIHTGLGKIQFGDLAGTGTRVVTADLNGILGFGGLAAGYQQPAGTVNSTNKMFVFTVAPNVVVVDQVPRQRINSDGTVNWTIVGTTITLALAPTFDIYSTN